MSKRYILEEDIQCSENQCKNICVIKKEYVDGKIVIYTEEISTYISHQTKLDYVKKGSINRWKKISTHLSTRLIHGKIESKKVKLNGYR